MGKETKLEEEILASFERGEWQPVPKNKSEIARFAAMASASLAVWCWANDYGLLRETVK